MTQELPPLAEKMNQLMLRIASWSKPKKREKKTPEKKKFAGYHDRLMASAIDAAFIFLLLMDVLEWISQRIYSLSNIKEYSQLQQIEGSPVETPTNAVMRDLQLIYDSGFYQLMLLNSLAQTLVIGVVLVFVWCRFHTTPGKYLLGMRFAGAHGEGVPTRQQYIRRYAGFYLSLPVFLIGFIALSWDKEKRAWHDRIADTTVIYTEQGNVFKRAWQALKRMIRGG